LNTVDRRRAHIPLRSNPDRRTPLEKEFAMIADNRDSRLNHTVFFELRRIASRLLLLVAAISTVVMLATAAPAQQVDSQPSHADAKTATGVTATAIQRSIALVERSAAEYCRRRECFSCHHQATAVLMLGEARRRGFAVDEENLHAQLDHTAAHLHRGLENYQSGQGQGGRVDTAAWALWTLDEGGRGADETTAAVAGYLIATHADKGHWLSAGERPPTQGSPFATTYVALRGLVAFGASDERSRIDERIAAARKWLETADAGDTEDRVYRLRALAYLAARGEADVDAERIEAAAYDVLRLQRTDGGWGQTPELPADAYATGTALVALVEAQKLGVKESAYRASVDFLLGTQLEDGSWRVTTRSQPIQKYFESGFPHEKDQFVSMAATNWATLALLFTVDDARQ
jgi:N-acyl-D-amino-acid deacylase